MDWCRELLRQEVVETVSPAFVGVDANVSDTVVGLESETYPAVCCLAQGG